MQGLCWDDRVGSVWEFGAVVLGFLAAVVRFSGFSTSDLKVLEVLGGKCLGLSFSDFTCP